MEPEPAKPPDLTRPLIVAGIAVLILTAATVAAYRAASRLPDSIILPGGVTYLGPSPTAAAAPTSVPTRPTGAGATPALFTAASGTVWTQHNGRLYPYSFSAPTTLALVTFPNDQNDAVAIAWGNTPPQQNILLNVERIKQNPVMNSYVSRPKRQYVENWWQQFSGLKGVATISEFTNAKDLKGYLAKYVNLADQTPNEDVFLEVPGKPDLMIHLANGVLAEDVFNRLVDSVAWEKSASAK